MLNLWLDINQVKGRNISDAGLPDCLSLTTYAINDVVKYLTMDVTGWQIKLCSIRLTV